MGTVHTLGGQSSPASEILNLIPQPRGGLAFYAACGLSMWLRHATKDKLKCFNAFSKTHAARAEVS